MAPYENSLWYVETNTHPLLEMASKQPDMVNYLRPSFWSRFMELQSVMWETNAGLTARHAYDSRPSTWPVLRRGINYWAKDHRQVYLLGNPFVWYGSLCAIMVYAGARALLMLRAKRGHKDFNDSTIQFYDQTAGFLALGWAMHYLPFFAMHRQLFLHHYLPALYFSILLLAVLFDALTSGLRPKFRFLAALAVIGVAFLSFLMYSPITYATPWTSKSCERARLLKTWDLNCHEFPNDIRKYADYGPGIHTVPHSSFNQTYAAAGGDTTASAQGIVPQAGNHPFEQAPQQAAASFKSGYAGASMAGGEAADRVQGAVPPAPGVPPVAPGAERQKEVEEQVAKEKVAEQKEQEAADIKGLDQEGVEEIVLGGTKNKKDQARTKASGSNLPSGAPPAAPEAPHPPVPDGGVHVAHDN